MHERDGWAGAVDADVEGGHADDRTSSDARPSSNIAARRGSTRAITAADALVDGAGHHAGAAGGQGAQRRLDDLLRRQLPRVSGSAWTRRAPG